jgi:hypothetical protein
MTYEILNGETVINTIVADLAFMQANYPNGNYRKVPEPVPVPVPTWVVTRNAFQNRFPMISNGVSTKYDLMTLFLTDTGYAESLGVTGADLYSLRSMIIAGNNRLGVGANVDLQAQETIGYVNMTTNASFPEVFRLTAAEASAILDTPAEPNETP